MHFGTPTKDQKEAYTRVLIGQIQLSTLTFPSDLTTSAIDVIARAPLWEVGLDYEHGTSHGVGSFSSVHEGKDLTMVVTNLIQKFSSHFAILQ